MIFLGTDIEEVDRFERLLQNKPKILQKIFTANEWEYATSKITSQTLAGIWCAKEAVLKAFSPISSLDLREIEIVKSPKGFPTAVIHQKNEIPFPFKISLSISHTKKFATATALVELIQKEIKSSI